MTCIVGLADEDGVVIGADSSIISGNTMELVAVSKVFRRGDMLFSYTSSFRMGQLLQYSLDIPPNDCINDDQYMATKFVDAVRECFQTGGFIHHSQGGEEEGGNFIIGYRGKLWEICPDFQATRHAAPYIAVGSGYAVALGALMALSRVTMSLEKRAYLALEASAVHCTEVRPPFHIEKL